LRYSIIDIEATGGNPQQGRITEIAIYVHDGSEIVDHYTTLVNPEMKISKFITSLTGISNEMVAEAPKFKDVAKKIEKITRDSVFVAHNVHFDYRFLQHQLVNAGFEFDRYQLCTVHASRKFLPGKKSYSLGKLCKEIGIPLENRHRADGDALATVKLFELLMQEVGIEKMLQYSRDWKNNHKLLNQLEILKKSA